MPGYKKHTLFNLFVGLPLCLLVMYYGFAPTREMMIFFAGSFAYCTLFMSPDLDLAYHIKPWSIRGILAFPFLLYAKKFRHRGISHSIFLGSISRIIWLGLWLACFATLAYFIVPSAYFPQMLKSKHSLIGFFKVYKPQIFYAIGGLCCADWGHIILDYETSRL
ncbi:MAG: DUF2227 family putative metal-binding protein [Cytophagales bacterium]